MSREAYFIIDCSLYSDDICRIISALNSIGWKYSADGQSEYLPLHDNDSFDWKKDRLSDDELFSVISEKQQAGELCGVILYHQETGRGVALLARNTKEIMINININRKTLQGDFTDLSWYIETIAVKLEETGCTVQSVRYTEIIG